MMILDVFTLVLTTVPLLAVYTYGLLLATTRNLTARSRFRIRFACGFGILAAVGNPIFFNVFLGTRIATENLTADSIGWMVTGWTATSIALHVATIVLLLRAATEPSE